LSIAAWNGTEIIGSLQERRSLICAHLTPEEGRSKPGAVEKNGSIQAVDLNYLLVLISEVVHPQCCHQRQMDWREVSQAAPQVGTPYK
jgi:hypothetical protein